jgi:uncharacterized damage-inducible protein DinB
MSFLTTDEPAGISTAGRGSAAKKQRGETAMTVMDRIRGELERAHDGDPWCGPSFTSLLAGLSASQAAQKVSGVVHSIWEIVLHVAAWQVVVAERIAGKPIAAPSDGDWPPVGNTSESAWRAALSRLNEAHGQLLRAIESIDESRLDRKVGDSRDPAMGSGMTVYANLHGIAQHSMYHAGQISLLKKLVNRE